MATNEVYAHHKTASLVCDDPATPASGDPVTCGQIPGVALTDEGDGGNGAAATTVALDGVFDLSVKGVNGSGNSAVAVGDIIYYVPGNTPKLSKAVGDAGAVRFGYALGTVNSGATATILVKVGY